MARRRKITKMSKKDSRTHVNVEQACILCGVIADVDELIVSNTCSRCTSQLALKTTVMAMVVSDRDNCEKCGQETSQILRKMSPDGSQIKEHYICEDCYIIKETVKVTAIKSERPAGWRFMAVFVASDGTVFHRGEEQPDLKDTLPPTDVSAIKAAQKERKREKKLKKKEMAQKREEKMALQYTKKMKKLKKDEAKKSEKLENLANGIV